MPSEKHISFATCNLYNLQIPTKSMYWGNKWTKKQYKKKVKAQLRKKRVARRPASKAKQGFRRLSKSCGMYSSTSTSSQRLLNLKKGKKLWVEYHGLWMKGFRKSGEGFISADCF